MKNQKTNTISTRRNVTSDLPIHFYYVTVSSQRLCELNARESSNKEGFNQIGGLVIW